MVWSSMYMHSRKDGLLIVELAMTNLDTARARGWRASKLAGQHALSDYELPHFLKYKHLHANDKTPEQRPLSATRNHSVHHVATSPDNHEWSPVPLMYRCACPGAEILSGGVLAYIPSG